MSSVLTIPSARASVMSMRSERHLKAVRNMLCSLGLAWAVSRAVNTDVSAGQNPE